MLAKLTVVHTTSTVVMLSARLRVVHVTSAVSFAHAVPAMHVSFPVVKSHFLRSGHLKS